MIVPVKLLHHDLHAGSDRDCDQQAERAQQFTADYQHQGNRQRKPNSEWGEASKRLLEAAGYNVEWHDYRMEHSVCFEEVEAIGAWLAKVLP